MSVIVLNHSMIKHKLTNIRRKETTTKDFYQNVEEIAGLMAFEISRDFPLREVEIETPICKTIQHELAQEVVIVPILRAGLGMVDGIRNMIPTAKVGFIGLYRDEKTLQPHEYYAKFPDTMKADNAVVLVVDPMLATGGSAVASALPSAVHLCRRTAPRNRPLGCSGSTCPGSAYPGRRVQRHTRRHSPRRWPLAGRSVR